MYRNIVHIQYRILLTLSGVICHELGRGEVMWQSQVMNMIA
jgi:hypothetical protein